ncbi:MAG: mechanosensitive ion channel family protein [Arenimonas sp.]
MDYVARLLERVTGNVVAQHWLWRIGLALGLLVLGIWLARWLARLLDRLMRRLQVEDILRNFLRNLAYAIAMVVVFIAALDFIGVPTTSLLAVLGAAGLAIGLALKDSLSNIASGVMLIVLRPFHAGDHVQIAGLEGVVDSVRVFQTRMVTGDNREIILPNSQITAVPIINYTGRGERRIDLLVPMSFGEDLSALRTALLALAGQNPRVKPSPKPEVLVTALGEGTVSVQLRAWVAARDYASVQSELLEAALGDFARRGLRAPLPQRELHVHHHGIAADEMAAMQELIKPAL